MDVIRDVNGRNSFSDICGNKLYLIQMIIKSCILLSKRPYIVAPQTIGQFKSKWARWFCNLYVAHAKGVSTKHNEEIINITCKEHAI